MRSVRLLLLSDYFHPHRGGGVEAVVLGLATRLASRGHVVRVLSIRTSRAPRTELLDGVEIVRSPGADLSRLLGFQAAFSLELPVSFRREIHDFRPDLVHAHNLFFRTTEIASLGWFRRGVPLVTTLHLGDMSALGSRVGILTRAYERTLGRLVLRSSRRVIAVSRAVADHARALGTGAEKLEVINNAVDSVLFHPPASGERTGNRVLFVGRLVPNKGPQHLLRAAPAVLRACPTAEFWFVGEGPLLAELNRLADVLGVRRSVRFLGHRSDVPALMREATVLVRPSHSEGMPLAVLEAMASALPVVATRVGGVPEIVSEGVTGFMTGPGDEPGLAAGIMAVLRDPRKAEQFGRAGRAAVATGHSWEGSIDRHEAVYARALQT